MYKTKKWDKEIDYLFKIRKKNYDQFGISSTEQLNINSYLKKYQNYIYTHNNHEYNSFDYIELFSLLGIQYFLAAGIEWLLYNNFESCIGNFLLFLLATQKVYDFKNSGITTRNIALKNSMEKDNDQVFLIAHTAIALNQFDLWLDFNPKIQIIQAFYQEDIESAKYLVSKLPSHCESTREVYYYDDIFLKDIYIAILQKDEKKFNYELLKRIRKLRNNPVGYSTYVDLVSISLIKLAKKYGLNYTFDVIEIPVGFFSDNLEIDRSKYKLPDIEGFKSSITDMD